MEAVLKTRGFEVVGDLLGLTPLRYEDRRSLAPLEQLEADREVLTAGRIQSIREGRFPKSGRPYFEITVAEGEGRLLALWFRLPVHLRRTFKAGQRLILFGRPQDYKGSLSMVHPEVRPWDGVPPPGEVRPIYPEIEGVRPGALRRVMGQAVQDLTGLPAVFPRTWLEAHRLNDPLDDLRTLHRPPADRPGPLPRPEESRAGRNLALFELLYLQLILMRSRARQNQAAGWACPENSKLAADFLAGLPFRLTPGQDRAWEEIRGDLITPRPMNRLLQGDVGSGKTVLALAAALTAVD
ncbi:MAG: hypothetical protein KKB20_04170, partial [Proteobacteria bacterium]|nr:hypothetical protein [Pseudomonadota bacterium]